MRFAGGSKALPQRVPPVQDAVSGASVPGYDVSVTVVPSRGNPNGQWRNVDSNYGPNFTWL